MRRSSLALLLAYWALGSPALQAANWYWRPNDGTASGTGDTYAGAWRKSTDIDWTAIAAGDTLFVCGRHEYGYLDRELDIRRDGITVSFECPDDPGSILFAGIRFPANHAWTGPDRQGTFQTPYGGVPVIAMDGSGNRLVDLGRPPTNRDPCPAYGHRQGVLYYRPCGVPQDFYPGGGSPLLAIRGRSQIRVIAADLSNGGRLVEIVNSTNVAIERPRLHWAAGVGIIASGSSADVAIVDGEFDSTGQGIVAVAQGTGPDARHRRWRIAGNSFHDMRDPQDGHCIGLQSVANSTIEGNQCERAGSGIVLYRWQRDVISYVTIRDNIIRDMFAPSEHWGGYGIALTGDACLEPGGSVGNLIAGNRIMRASTEGIYIKVRGTAAGQPPAVTVAGNEITDSPGGIRWRLVSASGAAQFTPNFALEGNRFTGVARPLIRPDFVPPRGACP